MSDRDERTLPGFAAARQEIEQFSVERESCPDHDGKQERIRIRDEMGAPSSLILLVLIREANADGWRLDEHTDHGQELVFVPFEDDDEKEGDR